MRIRVKTRNRVRRKNKRGLKKRSTRTIQNTKKEEREQQK
jgi:hypothetical protein